MSDLLDALRGNVRAGTGAILSNTELTALIAITEAAQAVLMVFDAPAEAHPADVASSLQYSIDVILRSALEAALKKGK